MVHLLHYCSKRAGSELFGNGPLVAALARLKRHQLFFAHVCDDECCRTVELMKG
uniref:Uncharacterized protein n=1 Tax=Meloidogyne incognita TaxID=6306 RepID=A0A914N778_MELIC